MHLIIQIPCFNEEKTLPATIRDLPKSIPGISKIDILIIDDGSTDGTTEEIRQYGGRGKLLQHSENRGVSAARNKGILHARGKYIAFLDSDDLWVKGKLKIQVAFLDDNPHYPICYTDEIWIRKGKRVNPMLKHAKYSGWIFEKCLPLCIISPSSVMTKRSARRAAAWACRGRRAGCSAA